MTLKKFFATVAALTVGLTLVPPAFAAKRKTAFEQNAAAEAARIAKIAQPVLGGKNFVVQDIETYGAYSVASRLGVKEGERAIIEGQMLNLLVKAKDGRSLYMACQTELVGDKVKADPAGIRTLQLSPGADATKKIVDFVDFPSSKSDVRRLNLRASTEQGSQDSETFTVVRVKGEGVARRSETTQDGVAQISDGISNESYRLMRAVDGASQRLCRAMIRAANRGEIKIYRPQ